MAAPAMSIFELLNLSFTALIRNRLRSLLTILGIVIGVGAVVALVSFGQSYQSYVDSQFQGIGATTLFISSTNPNGPNAKLITVKPLTMGDYEALADTQNVAEVQVAAPSVQTGGTLVAGNNSMSTEITGSTPAYEAVQSRTVSSGRFLVPNDINTSTLVAVIGTGVVQKLFPEGNDPIGQPIRINTITFTVVGVLQSNSGGNFADRTVIVPITTAQSRLGGTDTRTTSGEYRISQIALKATSADVMAQAQIYITSVLSPRHHVQYIGERNFRSLSPSPH